jgi:hypothetical protein
MIKIDRMGGTEYMSVEEFSRWMCLVEAFDFIEKHAEELGVNYSNMIKPTAIEKYIIERFHAMRYDVGVEHERGTI